MSRSDQVLLGGVIVAVGLLVMLSLRGTRPGAPARMGAIVAGIVLLLALMVGLRAHDLTNPRSDDRPAPVALRPTTALAFGGAVVNGDPQSGLSVRSPAGSGATSGAYVSDAEFCDGRLEATVDLDDAHPSDVAPNDDARQGTEVAAIDAAPSGVVLGIRAGSDPDVPPVLSIVYTPDEQLARVVSANGSTLASLTSAATEPSIRVDLRDTEADVWFDGQRIAAEPVPVTGGCGAVRFSAWGSGAVLHDLVIRPAV